MAMNRSQKSEVRRIESTVARVDANRFKGRGGRAEAVHGSRGETRGQVQVLSGNKVNPDDYTDVE
jgi:hypothetical protein